MECRNHPGTPATTRCAGCAEAFCDNCLVPIRGQMYCGSCKVMAVKDKRPPAAALTPEPTVAYQPASQALIVALIAPFIGLCFYGLPGMLLGPVAIFKGIQARAAIAQDPRLRGSGMAMVAVFLGVVSTALGLITLIGVAASKGGGMGGGR